MIRDIPPFPEDTAIIVVIPVLDDREIFDVLVSLQKCRIREGNAGIIVVVNHSVDACPDLKERNREIACELEKLRPVDAGFSLRIIKAYDLSAKEAGVGSARKIGMDAALRCLALQGNTEAPIVSLDADTLVEENYLDEIVRFFRKHPVAGVSIAYAHRLDELEGDPAMRDAVVKYELYLRYYQFALQYAGHPHAFPCIGSAFAVRARDYAAQGGMNRKKAGEDFYFLQKLISSGRYAMMEETRVWPSPRLSSRTPFGTGQSVRKIMADEGCFPVYHFGAFRMLKVFFNDIEGLYKKNPKEIAAYFDRQPEGVRTFLTEEGFLAMMADVNGNCASEKQFRRRFFEHFNAFQVLKFLNHVHPSFYPRMEVCGAVSLLLEECGIEIPQTAAEMLAVLRKGISLFPCKDISL